MMIPTNNDAFRALLLRAADNGRGEVLFGSSMDRVIAIMPDFLQTVLFPSIYLEFPLTGSPFLDVTVLYDQRQCGRLLSVDSVYTKGTREMLRWFSGISEEYSDICLGYELDTKDPSAPAAGVHFMPNAHLELVEPFCRALGENGNSSLYLNLAERLKDIWPLSFFGMFMGRPNSPLRVCGYLSRQELNACANDQKRIEKAFQAAGFTAYDRTMLEQIVSLIHVIPGQADFQFDLYPDGSCGNVFAIDARFDLRPSMSMIDSFGEGANLELMRLLEKWGIADDRWKQGIELSFTRGFPVETEDCAEGTFAMSLLPQWIKIRWTGLSLQPSKLYLQAKAGVI